MYEYGIDQLPCTSGVYSSVLFLSFLFFWHHEGTAFAFWKIRKCNPETPLKKKGAYCLYFSMKNLFIFLKKGGGGGCDFVFCSGSMVSSHQRQHDFYK